MNTFELTLSLLIFVGMVGLIGWVVATFWDG